MTDLVFTAEVAVGLLIALVGGFILAMLGRRRAIARGKVLTMCGLRSQIGSSWRSGFVRFGEDVIEWYALGGVSVRPRHTWQRRRLDLGAPSAMHPGAGLDAMHNPVRVACTAARESLDPALADARITPPQAGGMTASFTSPLAGAPASAPGFSSNGGRAAARSR